MARLRACVVTVIWLFVVDPVVFLNAVTVAARERHFATNSVADYVDGMYATSSMPICSHRAAVEPLREIFEGPHGHLSQAKAVKEMTTFDQRSL